jgi:hypothetical protein
VTNALLCALLLFALPSASAAPRKCAVADGFYPGDPMLLAKSVDGYLAKAPAPGKLPGPVVALLVPHAGYAYSAPVAATGYRAVADAYDTVVVLGAAHTVRVPGAALYAGGPFETPLGTVPVDDEVNRLLLKDPLFKDMPEAHAREHSIEVQLPFLVRRLQKGFKLVPIVMNTEDPEVALRVGRALGRALKGRKALIVVSSDLSHYPPAGIASRVDRSTLLALERMDPDYFRLANRILMSRGEKGLDTVYCGEAGLLAGLAAARALGADRGTLLRYANSGETPGIGDKDRTVGYAAMAFVRTGKPSPSDIPLTPKDKSALLALARRVVSEGVEGRKPAPSLSEDPVLNQPAAAFVTLTEGGALRGCIGTVEARMPLQDAVAYGAYSAAFEDHRFPPVTKEELPKLRFEVSLLSPSRKVPSHASVVPKKHGVILSQGRRSGLFLPQVWEGIPDKAEFLGELCAQKAGLPRDCWKDPQTELRVFTVGVIEEAE